MTAVGQPGLGWTVVLRRRPARIVAGEPEGGYTSVFEIICCYCGDDPEVDYREVSPELRRIRGPYPVAAGVAAYSNHLGRHQGASAADLARQRLTAPMRPIAVADQ
jgi:hypothetical protein